MEAMIGIEIAFVLKLSCVWLRSPIVHLHHFPITYINTLHLTE